MAPVKSKPPKEWHPDDEMYDPSGVDPILPYFLLIENFGDTAKDANGRQTDDDGDEDR